MISRLQQILLKRAQKQAGLDDADYRDAIQQVTGLPGCRSSKDARLSDEHIDRLLSYFEAIYWRRVGLGELQAPCKPDAVFQKPYFWATKNTRLINSRDRYLASPANPVKQEIAGLEAGLARLGFGQTYCDAIREKVTPGNRQDAHGLHLYKAALKRTLAAKRKSFSDTRSVVTSRT